MLVPIYDKIVMLPVLYLAENKKTLLKLGEMIGAIFSPEGIFISKILWTFYKVEHEKGVYRKCMKIVDRIASKIYKIPKIYG
jgi:hypothetical protein